MRWTVIDGVFHANGNDFKYAPEQQVASVVSGEPNSPSSVGLIIGSDRFSGGDIQAKVKFSSITKNNAAEIVVYFDPNTRTFLSAGLGGKDTSFL